jgi:hypothetical protein
MDIKLGGFQITSDNNKTPEGQKNDASKVNPSRITEKDIFDLYGQRKEYFSWVSKPKLQKTKFSPKSIRSFSIIGVVAGLILAIMGEFFLLLLIISVLFFMNVVNRVETEDVRYTVSNYGISIDDNMYYWFNLKHFFLFNKDGEEMLAVDTTLNLPRRLFISLGPGVDTGKLTESLLGHIAKLQDTPSSVIDKTYDNIIGKFDL